MPVTDPAEVARVAAYYDSTQRLYSRLWSSRGVHYGLWDDCTRNREEAMRNLDVFVGAELALPAGARVLDAGCGIGGTSLNLARYFGLRILGITLSTDQLRRATAIAESSGVSPRPDFEIRDYLATGLPDASFDGIVAIESSCYARRKEEFLAEAWRLLRPGGRLVVADGFIARPLRPRERRHLDDMLRGWAMVHLEHEADFVRKLGAAGFRDVVCHDKQRQILRSAWQIARLSAVGMAVMGALWFTGRIPGIWVGHGIGGLRQLGLFRSGALGYRVFRATKA